MVKRKKPIKTFNVVIKRKMGNKNNYESWQVDSTSASGADSKIRRFFKKISKTKLKVDVVYPAKKKKPKNQRII